MAAIQRPAGERESSELNAVTERLRGLLSQRRSRLGLLAAAAILLAAGFFWLADTRSDAASPPGGPQSVTVDAAGVTRADVPVYLEGLGTIQAFNTVTVTARVDGELQKLGFVEGQMVKKGDLLAQIDPRPFQAALGQALAAKAKDEATLQSAKADLERYILLAPENLASKQTLDAQHALVSGLEAQIKGDQANIDNARTQLAYTTIVSPIEGKTGIRRVDAGNNVHATDTTGIVVVTQMQPITLIFTLPEEALPAVSTALGAGQVPVSALSRDGTTELDRGTLALIDNEIDQGTGTIRLKAVFPNTHNTLWPGQYIDARVLVRTERNALTIPTTALQRGPNGMFTYVVKADSTVEARPLRVGEESGSLIVVHSGISDGEQVVTSNQYRLQPGVHVKVSQIAKTPRVAELSSDEKRTPAETAPPLQAPAGRAQP